MRSNDEAIPAMLPRLRGDLIISRQEGPDGIHYIVKDPRNRRFYRLGEAEHRAALLLDGRTTPAGAARALGGRPGDGQAEAIGDFIDSLGRLGLLEGSAGTAASCAARPGRRVRGDALYLRFRAFDPDRLLAALARRLGWCFTPAFVLATGAVILGGAAIWFTGWHEMARDVAGLLHVEDLAAAWLTLLLVTAAHEMAHGVACRRFGGEVHEMGFMLIYFHPAMYCNVTEAWLFPERSRRLWVTLAGPWLELSLWGASAMAWRALEPGTWPARLALIVTATSGIKTLFNLNPLVKHDGYYLLSDLLRMPNLRARAFAAIAGAWRRGAGGGPAPAPPDRRERRERRRLYAYGLLAGAYSIAFLGLVLAALGGFLVQRYQAAGFVTFALLAAVVIRRSIAEPSGGAPRAVPAPGAPPEEEEEEEEAGSRPAPARPPWRKRPVTRRAILAAAILALAVALGLARADLRVAGDVRVLPVRDAEVRAPVSGVVEEVFVREGDHVEPGSRIARLSCDALRADLARIEGQLAEARARAKIARDGPRPAEIRLASAGLDKARERDLFAARQLERAKTLEASQLISREQLDQAEEDSVVRRRELEEARAALQAVRAGPRPEEGPAAEAVVASLEKSRDILLDQIARADVISPVAGIVATPLPESKIGQSLQRGDLIVDVHELSTVIAEIDVPEKEIGEVRVGQPVIMKALAYPDLSFRGRVARIAAAAQEKEAGWSEKVIRVAMEIENDSGRLRAGMTGVAKISCGRRPLLEIVSRRLSRYLRVEFWSWW